MWKQRIRNARPHLLCLQSLHVLILKQLATDRARLKTSWATVISTNIHHKSIDCITGILTAFQTRTILMYSNLQASLRESWLDDMMHVLEGEALGQDAATVEAAFKRHEAIATDVKARVSVKMLSLMYMYTSSHHYRCQDQT